MSMGGHFCPWILLGLSCCLLFAPTSGDPVLQWQVPTAGSYLSKSVKRLKNTMPLTMARAQMIEDWSQLTLSLPLLAPGSNHSWKKILHSSTLFVAVPIPSVMSVGFAARQPKTAKKAKAIGSFAALYFFAALLLLLLLLLFQPGQNTKFPLDPSRRSASTTVLRETATRLLLVGVWWAEVSVLVHALVSCPLVFLVGWFYLHRQE